MKKILITLIVLTAIIGSKPVRAQFESFGGGIALATGGKYEYDDGLDYSNKSFGFDLRAVYDFNKKLDIVPDIKFYLPNKTEYNNGSDKVTAFAFNLNLHYILNPRSRDNYRVYILGGAHVGMWQIKDDHYSDVYNSFYDINEFKFFPGANVGAGMQLSFNDRFMFFAEAKYVLAKTNQLVFTPGFLFYL
ncbi:MAG: porin family protein [Bacteroidetes bacterium]|nr:porin family protein [Bacteroidota bacterium]